MKHISLEDILLPGEIERAREIYNYANESNGVVNFRLVDEIVKPNIARINKATGQENDPRFIGYAIEYCLMREKHVGKARGPRREKRWHN